MHNRHSRLIRLAAPAVVMLSGLAAGLMPLSASAADPVPTIADLAPKNAFVVINIPDYRAMRASFDRSSLGGMVKDREIRAYVKHLWETREQEDGGLDAVDKEIDSELEQLEEPVGAVGMAFTILPPKAKPQADGNLADAPPPEFEVLMTADFGEHAEANEQRLLKALEIAERDKQVEVTPENYEQLTIHVIKNLPDPDDAAEDEADGMDEEDGFDPDNPLESGLDALDLPEDEPLYMVRVDSVIVAASTLEAAQRTADRLRGERASGGVGAAAEDKTMADSLAQHPTDPQIYAVIKVADPFEQIMSMASDAAGGDPFAMMPMNPMDINRALGFTEIQSLSVAMRFDTPTASLDTSVGVLIPDKKGLIALFDAPDAPFTPPPFAPPEASSVTKFTFKFDKLIETARSVVGTFSPEMRQQAEGGLAFIEAQFGPALATLGPEVYSVSSLERPLSPTSNRDVLAIKTSDALAFVNAFGAFAPQLGLEPADFEGNQIFAAEGSPMAVGVGFDHVFVGGRADVENAMRSAANPAAAGGGIKADPAFRTAAAAIAPAACAHTFTRMRDTLEWTIWSMQNAQKIQRQEYIDMGWTPEDADSMIEPGDSEVERFLKNMPSAEVWAKYLGDSAGDFRSTPDGFRGKTLILRK